MDDSFGRWVEQIERRIRALETVEKLYVPVWDDYVIQIGQSRLPASSAPSVADWKGSQVLSFSKSATNKMFFTAQLPHGYKAGSNIEFHIHVGYPTTPGVGNSRWQLTHSWANVNGDFPSETTVTVTAAAPNVLDRHSLIEIASSITGTGKGLSSVVLGSIARLGGDAADTYDDVILLLSAGFHIQRDALGSREELTK